ncbi:Helix-turn-helix domain-containing protein [Paenibacillaceae bacterium GAS479]|nr:Helix-turn-helix domain-containing protein [Paenibacillaceae bacterium GAS479]
MPRVLIVDDEEMIRAGLSEMVPRLLPEWEVAGACPDAESAWEAIQVLDPDLVLLDIGMPGESGLVLASKLAKQKPDTEIIMLTGYDRFEYIQSALRSGVSEYLLKPVQRDELKESIVKVGEKIAKRNWQSGRLLVQALSEWVVAGEEQALQTLLDLLASEGHLGHGLSYQLRMMMYIKNDIESKGRDLEERHVRASENVDELKRSGAEIRKWAIVPLAKACDLLFLVGERLEGPIPSAEGLTGDGLLIACSDPVTDPSELPLMFRKAQKRLLRSILDGESMSGEEMDRLSRLTVALEMNDLAGTVAVLRQGMEVWKGMEPFQSLRGIFRLIAFFAGPQAHRLKSKLLKQMQPATDELTSRLVFAYDPIILPQEMEKFIERIAQLQPHAPEDRKIIGKVKEIIRNEFANPDFTLEQVASSVYLNATYLSELFKESTGQKFIDYVTEIRLSEARRMLLETDMKMGEVCASVGYTSSKYFSTLFRKRFDVTPTQYRESGTYEKAENLT